MNLISHNFKTPAELAVACQQWVELGSAYQAAWFAREAYRLARTQYPRTFRALEGL